jgi:hypothetical protein
LKKITERLRAKMQMQEIQDKDGFTDSGMPVSGAYPADLVEALKQDAAECGVAIQTSLARFSMETLKREIAASRPVLISCVVRLPQKPHLSWGHEVTGVGWLELDGRPFVGVRDNFLPSASGETIRWMEAGQCEILITIQPSAVVFESK